MGMDITSAFNNKFDRWYSAREWTFLLGIALAYGWKPSGTVRDGDANWGGYYDSNDQQYVTPDDARNLSLALSRALDDHLSRPPIMPARNGPAMSALLELERKFQGSKGFKRRPLPTDFESLARLVASLRDTAAKGGFWIW